MKNKANDRPLLMATSPMKIAHRLATVLLTACISAASAPHAQETTNDIDRIAAVPHDFLGTFANVVPGKIGGTVPDTKVSIRCKERAGCYVNLGQGVDRFANVR